MDRSFSFTHRHRGFSLVEMLAVIVIIGILASMIAAAAQAALKAAKIAAMNAEIQQLEIALETYKSELGGGDYPPSHSDDAARHFKRVFPRCTTTLSASFNPDTALYFWLAGPTGNGWSADPVNPMSATGSRKGPFYDFDPERVSGGTYLPFVGSTDPFVYFKAGINNYGSAGASACGCAIATKGTNPDGSAKALHPNSFQIHCPGLDGKYGGPGALDDATAFSDDRWDDMGNFLTKRIQDETL